MWTCQQYPVKNGEENKNKLRSQKVYFLILPEIGEIRPNSAESGILNGIFVAVLWETREILLIFRFDIVSDL